MAYTPANNTDFNNALTYYFDTTGTANLPGGTNSTAANVGQFNTSTSNKIGDWDTSNVTNMSNAFSSSGRKTFNEDISKWDTSQVTNFTAMFKSCQFGQNIRKWTVLSTATLTNMFEDSWILFAQEYILLENAWASDNINLILGPYGDSTKHGTPTYNFFNLTKPQLYYVKVEYQAGTTYQIDQNKVNAWYTDIVNNNGSWANTDYITIQCDKLQFTENVNWYHFLSIEIIDPGIEIDGLEYTINIIKAPSSSGLQYRIKDYTSTTKGVYTAFNGLIRNGNKLIGSDGNGGTIKNIRLTLSGQGEGVSSNMTLNIYSGFLLQEYTNYNSTHDLTVKNCLIKANNGFHIGASGNEGFLPDRENKYFSNPNLAQQGGISGRFLNSESTSNVTIQNCQSIVYIERSSSGLVGSYANYKSTGGHILVKNTKTIVKDDMGGTYSGFFGQGCNGDANGGSIEINACYAVFEGKSMNDGDTFADTYSAFFHSNTAVGANSSTSTEIKNSYSVRNDSHPDRIASIASSRGNAGKITVTNCFGSQNTHSSSGAIIANNDISLLNKGYLNSLPTADFIKDTAGSTPRYPRLNVFQYPPFNPVLNSKYANEVNYGSISIYYPDNNTDFYAALAYYFDESTTFITSTTNNASANSIGKYNNDYASIIGYWNTGNVTNIDYIFNTPSGRNSFNQDISKWNTDKVISALGTFYDCNLFNQDLSTKYDATNNKIAWDISNCSSIRFIFLNATNFNNGDLSGVSTTPLNWNTRKVGDLDQVFSGCEAFNQDIGYKKVAVSISGGTYEYYQWDTNKVTNMGQLFNRAKVFNQDISKWKTNSLTNATELFYNAAAFNQNVSTKVSTDDDGNKYIAWDMSGVQEMFQCFSRASAFNNGEVGDTASSPLSWCIDNVKHDKMWTLFEHASKFNQDIGTKSITLNLPVSTFTYTQWDVSGITDFTDLFFNASIFNQELTSWNVSNARKIDNILNGANAFNNGEVATNTMSNPLNWSFPILSSMKGAFSFMNNFNQVLGASNWDVSAISDMSWMFSANYKMTDSAVAGLNTWDVSGVTDMQYMFHESSVINVPGIANWNTHNVTNMSNMFLYTKFNEDISSWKTSKVTNMENMFYGASDFSQNIRVWDVSSSVNVTQMFYTSPITSLSKYTNIQDGWTNLSQGTPNALYFFNYDGIMNTMQFHQAIDYYFTDSSVPPSGFVTSEIGRANLTGERAKIALWKTDRVTDMSNSITPTRYGLGTSGFPYRRIFNQNIGNWNTENVVNMSNMFNGCEYFNQNIGNWNTNKLENVCFIFNNAERFNKDISTKTVGGYVAWDLSNLRVAENMLQGAKEFNNGEVATNTMSNPLDWKLKSISDNPYVDGIALKGMFMNCQNFNQVIGASSWDVSNSKDFSFMFSGCSKISDDALSGLNTWDTQNVGQMENMFQNCSDPSFVNPGISKWKTTNITSSEGIQRMFSGAIYFNDDISTKVVDGSYVAWNTKNIKSMKETFYNASSFNADISGWNIDNVSDLSGTFDGASSFSRNINTKVVSNAIDGSYIAWDYKNVTSMEAMFRDAINFNADISKWRTDNVKTMRQMFMNAKAFTGDINTKTVTVNPVFVAWDVSNVVDFSEMFKGASSFNSYIGDWNTRSAKNMNRMFQDASSIDQNLSKKYVPSLNYIAWDVSGVTDMQYMFYGASNYNNNGFPLEWNIDSISGDAIKGIFRDASNFNVNINTYSLADGTTSWDVSGVTIFSEIFEGASSFNNELIFWNVENALDMERTFKGATSFRQDIGSWFQPQPPSFTPALQSMSNFIASGGTTNGLKEMFKGASNFLAWAREWEVPTNVNIDNIFDGASDMSDCYFLRRSETGYNSTPERRFFNYNYLFDPTLTWTISYPNYYEDDENLAAVIAPATTENSGNKISLPYNLVFGDVIINSSWDRTAFYSTSANNPSSLKVTDSSNIYGAEDIAYKPITDNEKVGLNVRINFMDSDTNSMLFIIPININLDYGLLPIPPEPEPVPPPPNRNMACSKRNRRCKSWLDNPEKQGNFFNGNTNQPNFMAVDTFRYSNLVNYASARNAGKTTSVSVDLNVFGKRQGAAGGSGMRLRNKF